MKKTMEELREELQIMLDSNECSYEEILHMSQELDKLIIDYYSSKLSH
ncbi:aspartyl-phosphate phosphatase Spo0E family protein [Clostridium pasteurianum]|uniref:Spo0E like sporulation regulatory protein n=1 Tax=Clostridium pasteurianum BC1 TaxID=86416 RepID=R4K9F9_CLOPA|nr:aspartyl-phosphate phosphatase Spo0E family protein [Clostridium pasteurianum]AGK97159.1 Spo0E like sporulation regulatory protein [Clostridium pasteurianum BC1]